MGGFKKMMVLCFDNNIKQGSKWWQKLSGSRASQFTGWRKAFSTPRTRRKVFLFPFFFFKEALECAAAGEASFFESP